MTRAKDIGFEMLKQQYATPFRIPIRPDIWEKRGMFSVNQNLENEKLQSQEREARFQTDRQHRHCEPLPEGN